MKKKLLYFTLLGGFIVAIIASCNPKDTVEPASILPANFNIDVPSSISSSSLKAASTDTLPGNKIYSMLRAFVYVGNVSGAIVKDFMAVIAAYHIDRPMQITYTSYDDNRLKTLTVTEKQVHGQITFDYKMVVADAENNEVGLELYWNRAPISGTAIIKGYNLNRTKTKDKNATVNISYSEANAAYEKTMEVTIVGLDTAGVDDNVDNLKMFVGKKGNVIDIYGNANIPNYAIVDKNHVDGYNWAFVAHSNESLNISVAQVALPPCTLPYINNIFTNYSIKKVLNDEINKEYPNLNQTYIDKFLTNADSPAYFNGTNGFISCGATLPASPAGFTADFANLSALSPYIPAQINALKN